VSKRREKGNEEREREKNIKEREKRAKYGRSFQSEN